MADPKRREFITKLAQGAALACSGGMVWGYLLSQQAKASPTAIRPPGALPEADFNARCIKCGQCVVACPYDTLRLAAPGENGAIGTPVFTPRDVPCYMCEDIPCMQACPTGALSEELKDIDDSRMGLAIIDIENCLSWQGLRCEICYRDCPIKDKAISIENHPRKISKHAFFVPLVHSDACTGCGVCEKACPTDEAAIRVLPAKLVQGEIGKHYRLGWKFDTEITQDFKPGEEEDAPAVPSGLDYLNEGTL
ncbi:MAG: ferredoxin-type protein NapG [Gammaproteobacteria bacterium]|nr:ferredoxin-type protein NapG [Gammaproteobacteria bacterium]MCP5136626.1 ferredoxin-type protein NapG [Gammaproteobacteria bacterium]